MSAAPRKAFQLIGEDDPPAAASGNDALTKLNTEMLLLALSALSKRAMTAITNLFTIGLVVSAWYLCYHVIGDPTWTQLSLLCGYGVFALLIDIVRRRN